ncbi:DnaA regulatory inactivator Hda [Thiomicrorhabdus sediminis]|uniref:DnaA regulatory inactivator Hda n=1 Tax=Thiomicrorhabdus sediminis TaxID=2580412 RepID=A0A4P9K4Z6_9GAMM|nr:DnaA regulatory inactivator Hda [Thiomicrorhabdus sediminis]QCU89831.1 DnaA regulatory inactivator Hda [Thiomicrorhabdus sediminis]
MFVQMPLKIGLRSEACFATFVTEQESVAFALNNLQKSLKSGGGSFYMFGNSGVGKTHLLQAACRFITEHDKTSVYLPLSDDSLPLIPDVLIGLEQTPLVCLDDVDTIIGNSKWELALANLLVKSSVQGHSVILSGKKSISEWSIATQELMKALINVLPIEIAPLTDKDELISALTRHSSRLGFELTKEVGNYLIKQFSNDLQELLAVLKMLEQASLVEKHRLTLPFVKKILNQNG